MRRPHFSKYKEASIVLLIDKKLSLVDEDRTNERVPVEVIGNVREVVGLRAWYGQAKFGPSRTENQGPSEMDCAIDIIDTREKAGALTPRATHPRVVRQGDEQADPAVVFREEMRAEMKMYDEMDDFCTEDGVQFVGSGRADFTGNRGAAEPAALEGAREGPGIVSPGP